MVFGKTNGTIVELSALGTGGFVVNGQAEFDSAGVSVSGAGDINGDGISDIIVGARGSSHSGDNTGRGYAFFGKADVAAVELGTLGAGGVVLNGEAMSDSAGYSVSSAGDVNGDGMQDLIIGANGADPNGAESGRSDVVFGKADVDAVELGALGAGGSAVNGAAAGDVSGRSVCGAGGINGDGMDDLIIGAPCANANGAESGRSYVVFGKADAEGERAAPAFLAVLQ